MSVYYECSNQKCGWMGRQRSETNDCPICRSSAPMTNEARELIAEAKRESRYDDYEGEEDYDE